MAFDCLENNDMMLHKSKLLAFDTQIMLDLIPVV